MAHTRQRKKKQTFVEKVKADGVFSEAEQRSVRTKLNNGTISIDEAVELSGMKITPEQTKKGYDWLMKKWKTPKGKERLNNPFGSREQHVLENFKEFRLLDYKEKSGLYGGWQPDYVEVWEVRAKDGTSFDYFMHMGEPKLVS